MNADIVVALAGVPSCEGSAGPPEAPGFSGAMGKYGMPGFPRSKREPGDRGKLISVYF